MPLFVFLSGFFFKPRTFKQELSKCVPLIEVCVLSHLGFALIRDHTLTISNMLSFGATPAWYLLSLITWRFASSICLQKISEKSLLILSIVISILSFVLIPQYGSLFSLMRTLQFYPYFMLGYYFNKHQDHISIVSHKLRIFCIGGLSLVYVLYTSCRLQHVVFFQRDGLLELSKIADEGYISTFCYRYILILCGIFISTSVFFALRNNSWIQRFSKFGQNTLFVYYGQTLMFPLVNRYFGEIQLSLLMVIIAVCFLTWISIKPISKWLMNPMFSFLSLRKTTKNAV
jgi:fucose 4-O-acetylase-like acetyltransferase